MKNAVGIVIALFVITLVVIQYETVGITEPATMVLSGTGMAVLANLARRHHRSRQERDDVLQSLHITK